VASDPGADYAVGEAEQADQADEESRAADVLAGAGDAAMATRESRIGEAPAWNVLGSGYVPDPDTESSGYPRPLATAREATFREHGEMAPPPEIGGIQPRRESASPLPGAVTDTLAIAADAARPTDGLTSLTLRAVGTMTSTLRTDVDADAMDVAVAPIFGRAEAGEEPRSGKAADEQSDDADRAGDEQTTDGEAGLGSTIRADDDRAAEGDEALEDDTGDEPASNRRDVVVLDDEPELEASGDARASASLAEDPELVASDLGTVAPGMHLRDQRHGLDRAPAGRPIPWAALAGLAATLAGMAVLLLARYRRRRRLR
jgi:hypothetical protein